MSPSHDDSIGTLLVRGDATRAQIITIKPDWIFFNANINLCNHYFVIGFLLYNIWSVCITYSIDIQLWFMSYVNMMHIKCNMIRINVIIAMFAL